jgi:MFS family permease
MVARVGLVFAGGLTSIAAVVTADRIGKGVRTAPRDAMISASSDPAHLGRAFGVHRTLDTVGAALGPLIAFGVLWLVPEGFDVVMVVSLAFAVLGVAVLLLLVPDVRPRRARSGVPAPAAGVAPAAEASAEPDLPAEPFRWKGAFTPGLVRLLVVGGGLALVTVGDGFLYLALLDRSEFATYWFPMLYVGTNLAYLALALPLGRVADRVGRARVLVLGHLALVGAYACAVLPVKGAVATVVTLFLLGAFYAATDGVLAAVAARTVPAAVRATGIAAAQTVVAVGRLVASATFGLLWFTVGPSRALLYVGGVLLVLIPVALVVLTRLDEADA